MVEEAAALTLVGKAARFLGRDEGFFPPFPFPFFPFPFLS